MRYYIISIVILFYSCQSETKNSNKTSDQVDSANFISKLDTLASKVIAEKSEEEVAVIDNEEVISDKILVDRVHYFDETDELYIWLSYKEGYDWKAKDTIKSHADSVIYQEGSIIRTRFPMDMAIKYFDLQLLNGIVIFNESHESQGVSKIKRIEYFEDVMGDSFICILETPNKLRGNTFYGINGTSDFITSLSDHKVNDDVLANLIRNQIKVGIRDGWRFEMVKVEPYDLTYAFYSFLSDSSEEKTYLFEIDSDEITIVNEITNDFNIWELSPVSVQVNNRPILLLWLGLPETDIEWYSPAVFDGEKFDITNRRIIDLSKYRFNNEMKLFNQNAPFEVLELSSKKYPSSGEDSISCLAWELSKENISEFVKEFEPISGEALHYLFSQYPCSMSGTLSQNGQIFDFSVNAGSWLTISSDTLLVYGDTEGKFKDFFLDDVWTDEDYENE